MIKDVKIFMEEQKIGKHGWVSVWGCSVSWSLHIRIFTFFTELRRETPLLRHIQDLSSRVWVLHNDILTVVPRKEQTVPGE